MNSLSLARVDPALLRAAFCSTCDPSGVLMVVAVAINWMRVTKDPIIFECGPNSRAVRFIKLYVCLSQRQSLRFHGCDNVVILPAAWYRGR